VKVGFFGKLPGYGDFIQRGVSPALVDTWDNWILQSFEVSRAHLGNAWKDTYFNSPIWRFTIDGKLLNGHSISGIMMPSVDSAGRCYPFTVICQAQRELNLFTLAATIDKLHENCEDFILSLLEKKRPDLDEITLLLQQTYEKLKDYKCSDIGVCDVKSGTELCRLQGPELPVFSASNESFLAKILSHKNIHMSLWSTTDSAHFSAQKRYYHGLPPVDVFSSMLKGE